MIHEMQLLLTFYYRTVGVDGSQKCVYLAGNSLGLQPVGVKQLVVEELEKWKNKLAISMCPLDARFLS